MVAKVKAAADARTDLDLIIVARTDAIATDGFEAAIDARAAAYREAGADVGFVEAPKTARADRRHRRRLPWPQIINIVLGGRTPELPNDKLKELGFAGVLYANVALQASIRGMQLALGALRENGAGRRRRRCWRSISRSASGWSTRRRGTRWRRSTKRKNPAPAVRGFAPSTDEMGYGRPGWPPRPTVPGSACRLRIIRSVIAGGLWAVDIKCD